MVVSDFYRLARAYDIAFSDRNFVEECNFLEWCLNTYGNLNESEIQQKSYLEIACGPANHARIFAKWGWQTAGLDLSPSMIEYAKEKDSEAGVSTKYYCENMIRFSCEEKFALASNPLESISHILTNDDMVNHLRCVSESLVKGGVYVIEGTHPRYFFPDDEPNRWTSYDNDIEIELLFGSPDDEYNHVSQVWNVTTGITLKKNGRILESTRNISHHRWFLHQEFDLLIRLADCFSSVHYFGNANIPPHPLDDSENSDSMIIVLVK